MSCELIPAAAAGRVSAGLLGQVARLLSPESHQLTSREDQQTLRTPTPPTPLLNVNITEETVRVPTEPVLQTCRIQMCGDAMVSLTQLWNATLNTHTGVRPSGCTHTTVLESLLSAVVV